ncbi:glycine cleavage system protein H [Variovorax sp. dw_954]|uniref:glycine cleavage system protein H n=1 Tax=Variovorax sp. dw_954 TaxID=2720078 RepID=UPI002115D1F0|nr:glycine cleavage system protein H [Variovorax sp. dw_954]
MRFPSDLLYLVEHDVWARMHDDGTATVGITALGIKLSGEIYMCRAKPVGSEIAQGRAVAVVELAKAIVSVKSAVTGTVVEVNPRLEETPELVHRDPYGEGWLARLALRDFEADRPQLVQGDEVAEVMAQHAVQAMKDLE